jgi:hypothetical protein
VDARSYDAGMDALRKLTLLAGATLMALSLAVGPAVAQDEVPDDPEAEIDVVEEEEEGGRVAIAESPRDRLGLLFLGALVIAGGLGLANARRQLKGERPTASGEFRWR